jgi:glycosyltransferase involved in cell wall biosynthesis
MKSNNLVSIIMTCYNGEYFLDKAVKSIINQTYSNWELIFYNNFSNDRSLEIIQNFQEPRIKCFTSDKLLNLGQVRKKAIEVCNGEYICFLDVDDYWVDNKIEKQILKFKENKYIDLIYTNYFLLNKNIKTEKTKKLYKGICPKELLESYIDGNPITAWLTVMVKTKCIKKLEYTFDQNLHIASDMDFFMRLSQYCVIDYLDSFMAYYRIHDSNESKEKLAEIEELAYICNKYQENKEIKNFLSYKNFSDKIFIKNFLYNQISDDLIIRYKLSIKKPIYRFIFLLIRILPKKSLQKLYRCIS